MTTINRANIDTPRTTYLAEKKLQLFRFLVTNGDGKARSSPQLLATLVVEDVAH